MTPTTLNIAVACVTGAIASWRGILLIRDPRPTRGRMVVFVLFASAFVSNVLSIDIAGALVERLAPGLTGLARNLMLLGFFLGFVLFFGSALESGPFSRLRVQLQVAALVASLFVLGWLLHVPTGEPLEFRLLGPTSSVGSVLSFLTAHVYFGYACLASAFLAGRAAARAIHVSGRIAFALCSVGMVLALVGGPVKRFPETIRIATGGGPFPTVGIWSAAAVILSTGIVLVVFGLSIVALRTAVMNIRLWRQARRGITILNPLWQELCAGFPTIALAPQTSAGSDQRRLRGVLLRYRRRLVECRDGLWRLSPYVDDPDDPDNSAEEGPLPLETQAELVARALRHVKAGGAPVAEPVAIASAPRSGDDDGPLLALAQAFAYRTTACVAPERSGSARP